MLFGKCSLAGLGLVIALGSSPVVAEQRLPVTTAKVVAPSLDNQVASRCWFGWRNGFRGWHCYGGSRYWHNGWRGYHRGYYNRHYRYYNHWNGRHWHGHGRWR